MRIAVLMFGKHRGGVEQAAVDYCEALKSVGHEVTAFVRRGAAILPDLAALPVPIEQIAFPHPLNIFAHKKLQQKLQQYDVIIVHGNRAGQLTQSKSLPPVIAVAHSRFFKPLPHFAATIALSVARAKELGTPHVIPNMIRLPHHAPRTTHHAPPVIGAMGRFAQEKGFDLLLDALAILRTQGFEFRAVIGGAGPLESPLKAQALKLDLDPLITWHSWVGDKTAFFENTDIFCMPSRTESFPLTLLEAMAHAMPIIVTDCGGPSSIITHGRAGWLCAIDAAAIAAALAEALANPAQAAASGTAARAEAERTYAIPVVARQLDALLALAAR